jgi:hypothetical protein
MQILNFFNSELCIFGFTSSHPKRLLTVIGFCYLVLTTNVIKQFHWIWTGLVEFSDFPEFCIKPFHKNFRTCPRNRLLKCNKQQILVKRNQWSRKQSCDIFSTFAASWRKTLRVYVLLSAHFRFPVITHQFWSLLIDNTKQENVVTFETTNN